MSNRSEAWGAGLRPGDIVLEFNGRTVEDASALMRMIADSKVGSAAKLQILRESRRLDITVPITRSRPARSSR
jgi:S1-C subfamily serine protease